MKQKGLDAYHHIPYNHLAADSVSKNLQVTEKKNKATSIFSLSEREQLENK